MVGFRANVLVLIFFATLTLIKNVLDVQAASVQPKTIVSFAGINPRQSPLWIAQEQGLFNKNGVDVDLIFIRTGPIQVAAVSSGSTQIAYAAGSSVLGAVAGGADLKIIASFTNRLTYTIIARPNIKRPEELRGKRFGVQAIGGAVWMGAVLGLEHLGLEQRRDNISILSIGDQTVLTQALEAGNIDVTVLDGVFSRRLKQRGFSVLAELSETNIPYVSNLIVGTRSYFQLHPEVPENILKALIESLAFIKSPANKSIVINTLMKRLKISDPSVADQGYRDLLQIIDLKPYASLEGLRNVQRLTKIQNPLVGNVKAEEVIDNRTLKNLEVSGFLQRIYSAYGVK
jgi:ABC-type nitrate/sulfonate/bicarbonate transport system substrate-binding protein